MLRERATTADAVLKFVFGLPNGPAWNVLSFWRCHYKSISIYGQAAADSSSDSSSDDDSESDSSDDDDHGDIHWHAGPW